MFGKLPSTFFCVDRNEKSFLSKNVLFCVVSTAFIDVFFLLSGKLSFCCLSAAQMLLTVVVGKNFRNLRVQLIVQLSQSLRKIFVSGGLTHEKMLARRSHGTFVLQHKLCRLQYSFGNVRFQIFPRCGSIVLLSMIKNTANRLLRLAVDCLFRFFCFVPKVVAFRVHNCICKLLCYAGCING